MCTAQSFVVVYVRGRPAGLQSARRCNSFAHGDRQSIVRTTQWSPVRRRMRTYVLVDRLRRAGRCRSTSTLVCTSIRRSHLFIVNYSLDSFNNCSQSMPAVLQEMLRPSKTAAVPSDAGRAVLTSSMVRTCRRA